MECIPVTELHREKLKVAEFSWKWKSLLLWGVEWFATECGGFPVVSCECRQRFGAVIADKDGCCVGQSHSPGWFVVG